MRDIIQAGMDRQKGRIGNCATGAGMTTTTNSQAETRLPLTDWTGQAEEKNNCTGLRGQVEAGHLHMMERTVRGRTLTQRLDRSDWPNKQKKGIFGRVDSTGQVGQDILMQYIHTQNRLNTCRAIKNESFLYRQRRHGQDMTETESVDKRFTVQFSKAAQKQKKGKTR
jgi:hypothetical protein